MSSTEIGESCQLECDESKDEGLFEYQLLGDGFIDQYSVLDEKGDMILGCSGEDISAYGSFGVCSSSNRYGFSLYKHRACLPRTACYEFLTASKYYEFQMKQVMMSFDGENLLETDGFLFKSIPFGNCEAKCNPAESSVEL